MAPQPQLEIHPLDGALHIGTIRIEEDNVSSEIETIIILDKSGSMNDETGRFVNKIIPRVASLLSYDESQKIYLIQFSSTASLGYEPIGIWKRLNVNSEGKTLFAPAIKTLRQLFRKNLDANKPIRVLTISDGEIMDKSESHDAVKDLVASLGRRNFSINSQAVRLFTSSKEPDTRALCSLLQINNTTTSQLLDITKEDRDDHISTQIAKLFQSDNFSKSKSLSLNEQIIFKFPWVSQPTYAFMLLPGATNVFWLKEKPSSGKIGNVPVKIIQRKQTTLTEFQSIMEGTLVYILDHVKLLKVLNTREANKSVEEILHYFETTEDNLVQKCSGGEKQISVVLEEIANDKNLKSLDSAQMADYIRELTKKHKVAADQRKRAAAEKKRLKDEAEAEAEEKHLKDEAEKKRLKDEAAKKRIEKEEAEKKRLKDEAEAEEKRLKDEAEEKRLKDEAEAEEKRLKDEAEEKRLKDEAEAEEKRLKDEAEKKRLKDEAEAEEKRLKDEAEAEEKRLKDEAEAEEKRLKDEAAKKRIEKEEAEKKRLKDEAEEKRLKDEAEAEKKRLKDEAEKKRLKDEAEEKRLKDEAEEKRLKDEAEKKRLKDEADKQRIEKEEAEKKRLKDETEKQRLENERVTAEEKKRKEEAEQICKNQEAQQIQNKGKVTVTGRN